MTTAVWGRPKRGIVQLAPDADSTGAHEAKWYTDPRLERDLSMPSCIVSDPEPVSQVRAYLLSASQRRAQFRLAAAIGAGCCPEILAVLTSSRYAPFRQEIIGAGFAELCSEAAGAAVSSLIEVLLGDSGAKTSAASGLDMRIHLLDAQRVNRLGPCVVAGEMAVAALTRRRTCTEAERFTATAAGREAALVDTGASLDYLRLYL